MGEIYDSIIQGLNEAIAIERGEIEGKKTTIRIDSLNKGEEDADIVPSIKSESLKD